MQLLGLGTEVTERHESSEAGHPKAAGQRPFLPGLALHSGGLMF